MQTTFIRQAITVATAVVVLILAAGCTTSSIQSLLSDSAFQEQNNPLRTLRVVIVATERDVEKGKQIVRSTSDLIEPQVGIRLAVAKVVQIEQAITGTNREKALAELYEAVEKRGLQRGRDFDLAIGIAERPLRDLLGQLLPIPSWLGVIDDNLCRCFYVTKTKDVKINAHEVMHVFLFKNHHRGGLMASLAYVYLLPGVPISIGGLYLLPEDREEVLRNKWRDLNALSDNEKGDIEVEDAIVIQH